MVVLFLFVIFWVKTWLFEQALLSKWGIFNSVTHGADRPFSGEKIKGHSYIWYD